VKNNFQDLKDSARSIRMIALNCVHRADISHIGSAYSCADLIVYLYSKWLNISPETINDQKRDRFILSKGHAAVIYYSTLAEFGYFPKEWLDEYTEFNSPLGGHVQHCVPGIEWSTGSLGHGLPVAVGMALAAKRNQKQYRVVSLLSDGEMQSGSNWEA